MLPEYGSINCQVSTDCGLYFEKNACGIGCPVAISNAGLKELQSALDAFAQMACDPNCPPPPAPKCEPTIAPECWKGYCE